VGVEHLTAPDDARLARLRHLREDQQRIEARRRKTMITQAIKPRPIRVLPRGNWLDDSGPIVSPQVPLFLSDLRNQSDASRQPDSEPEPGRRNRLDLARWLTDAESGAGGLTARVQVNRFWYLLFGTGIARVLDDFGGQGEAPLHPELLDNLAVEFVEYGWDVKRIIKTLVMSRTYRLSSAWNEDMLQRDPYNQLFARQSQFRLPSEMIRDQALAISGLLVLDYGGPSVKPYQPAGYYRHLNFPTRQYTPDETSAQWRRGVYMHWQRQFLHPMLKATDAPSREECTAQRSRSNTPLAALVLLNDPTFVEAARVFAERILEEPDRSDEERLAQVFAESLFRSPDKVERAAALALLEEQRQVYSNDSGAADKLTQIGIAKRGEQVDLPELAAWTAVTRLVLNLNETITRR
jgi:hypothetical protein